MWTHNSPHAGLSCERFEQVGRARGRVRFRMGLMMSAASEDVVPRERSADVIARERSEDVGG